MGIELEGGRNPLRIVDMARFLNVLAQRPTANRLETIPKHQKARPIRPSSIRRFEARFIAEYAVVYNRNEAVELHKGILQGRRRQEQLEPILESVPQRLGPFRSSLFIDISQLMRF